MKAAVGLN